MQNAEKYGMIWKTGVSEALVAKKNVPGRVYAGQGDEVGDQPPARDPMQRRISDSARSCPTELRGEKKNGE